MTSRAGPPRQYVLRTRLRQAAMRLKEPTKIIEIALGCRCGDVSNFNHAFRAEFGLNPAFYRRKLNDERPDSNEGSSRVDRVFRSICARSPMRILSSSSPGVDRIGSRDVKFKSQRPGSGLHTSHPAPLSLSDGPEPAKVPRRPGLLMVLKVRFLP